MKKAKMMAAIAAAVTALNALCIPAEAVTVPDYGGDWTPSGDYKDEVERRFGPFYTLGTDVSAYELGDVTMDGKIDYTDCIAIQMAYNIVVLLNANNYLTSDQIALGDVLPDIFTVIPGEKLMPYPITSHDGSVIMRYLNYRDILEEPRTMEEVVSEIQQKRKNGGEKG